MAKKIQWKKNDDLRLALYLVMGYTFGSYQLPNSGDYALTKEQLQDVAAKLQTLGVENVTRDSWGALGQQLRWCIFSSKVHSTVSNDVYKVVGNRVAAVAAGWMTVEQALERFSANGMKNVEGPFRAAVQGLITRDEAVELIVARATNEVQL